MSDKLILDEDGNPIATEHVDSIVVTLSVDASEPVAVCVHPGDLVTIITSNNGWQPQIAAVEINRAGTDPEQAWIEAMRAVARRAEGTP